MGVLSYSFESRIAHLGNQVPCIHDPRDILSMITMRHATQSFGQLINISLRQHLGLIQMAYLPY
jgi:hypothetical protein